MKNGNIAVLASDSGSFYGKALKICLLNQLGNLIWSKKILPTDPNGYNGIDLVEGKNKNILILGYQPYPPGKSFLILIDSLGNKINDVSLNTQIYKVTNYYDEGYYAVGFGGGNANNITGSVMKINNSLNIQWYKLLQTQSGNSEFMDIIVAGRNNLIILNEPENYGFMPDLQRTGLTFIDSNGISRKNFLFTTDTMPIIPSEFLLLKNGRVLFTAYSPMTQYFGVTDTISNGFCKFTQINYPNINNTQTLNYNTFSTTNSTFNYSTTSLFVYQPFDLTIDYYCSSGPSGSLDPTNPINAIPSSEQKDIDIITFPNPASDFIVIANKSNENKSSLFKARIKLISSIGEIVLNYSNSTFDPYLKIDVKKFKSGIYYLQIEFENKENYSKKIIIRR